MWDFENYHTTFLLWTTLIFELFNPRNYSTKKNTFWEVSDQRTKFLKYLILVSKILPRVISEQIVDTTNQKINFLNLPKLGHTYTK